MVWLSPAATISVASVAIFNYEQTFNNEGKSKPMATSWLFNDRSNIQNTKFQCLQSAIRVVTNAVWLSQWKATKWQQLTGARRWHQPINPGSDWKALLIDTVLKQKKGKHADKPDNGS